MPAHARSERRAVVLVIAGSLAAIAAAAAQAARPAVDFSDEVVLEKVPPRSRDPLLAEIARRSRSIQPGVDTRLARLAIEAARRRSDPRYLGRAEAALGPAWLAPDPPAEALLLRATLKQARHDFYGALADLDRLIGRVPDHPQAQLTRAVILTVQGRYREALHSCAALGEQTALLALTCRAPALAATGADPGAELEQRLAGQGGDAWARSVLGELRFWAGDPAGAERHLRAALAEDPGDRYTRGLLADLLLDSGRPGEVVSLLAGQTDDAALLRLAIARRGRGGEAAELRARFTAARERADTTHSREQSRFALAIDQDAPTALALALDSWRVQREPWDARLVLAAARACAALPPSQREAVRQVEAFVAERGAAWAAVAAGGAR
jgi:hypothetical protein